MLNTALNIHKLYLFILETIRALHTIFLKHAFASIPGIGENNLSYKTGLFRTT